MRIGIDGRKIRDYGIGTYIQGLLGGLAELARGDEQYVVLAPADARELIPGAFEHRVVEAPHYSFRELFAVGRAAQESSLDLLHAPHYVVPFGGVLLVVTIHDLIHLHQEQARRFAALYAKIMIRRAVAKSARILTVSDTVKQELVEELGVSASKIVVTPNGVHDRFRRGRGELTRSRYFLYVGNDKPHKGVDAVVDAFSRLRKEIPDLSLLLVGARFERFQRQAGVITPGFVSDDELVPLVRHALALVQPSREEGFGLPAAEAMAAGTAVITSTAAALVETTGDAALHVPAGELADAMRRMATDSALRDELARRGIERASRFTWRECARITRRAYFEAMGVAGGESRAEV